MNPQSYGGFLPPFERRRVGPSVASVNKFAPTVDGLCSESMTSAGGGVIVHPFKIQLVDAETINIRYGTVMDVEPTGCGVDRTMTTNGVFIAYIDVEIDLEGELIGVSLVVATGALPANTDYHGYITIGQITVADNEVTAENIEQAVTHSLRLAVCSRDISGEVLLKGGSYQFWGV